MRLVCARPQKWETRAVCCIFDTEQVALCKSELRQVGLTLAVLGGRGTQPPPRINRWRRAVAFPLSIFNTDANTEKTEKLLNCTHALIGMSVRQKQIENTENVFFKEKEVG